MDTKDREAFDIELHTPPVRQTVMSETAAATVAEAENAAFANFAAFAGSISTA